MNRMLFLLSIFVIPLTVFAQLSNQSYKEKFLSGQMHEAIHLAEIRRPYLKSGEVPFHPVVIYFENFPSAEQMIAMRDLGAVLYADTWTPPVGRHPFGFMVASVPVEKLKDMAGLGFVQKLGSAAKTSKALNNTAAESVRAPLVWAKGFKGSGKKICILDSGIDISYQGTDLPATFQYKDYSYYPLLDDDVANTTTGHGTHVAATVLGRGVLSAGHKHWNNGNGSFQGIATEADMVFLKIGQDEDAMAEDAMTIAAIDAAVNIYNADIITMSYGGWDDFHDGSSALEQKVDWAYSMGVPFFCSAGNAADDDKHWMGTVPAHGASGFIELEVTEPNGDTLMLRFNAVWADGVKRNNISIQYFDATKQPLGNIITFPATESPRGTESMYSYFGNALTAGGTYYLKIINNSDDNQVVHIFEDWNNLRIGTDHVYFTDSEKNYTIGSPSSADHAFSVGAYVSKTGWTSSQNSNRWWGPDYVMNNIAIFSSLGPTLDNRVKPDLCAPGHVLISLRDKDVYTNVSNAWVDNDGIDGGEANYYSNRGTSMACPVTAGAAALYLQKFPDALPQQVYDAMTNYSNKTGLTNLPDNTWGYGKLDIDAAIRHFRNPIEIDGNLVEENYHVLASFTSTRNGFGNQDNIGALKFSSDGENMYVGVTGELTSNNNILVFIDFSGVQGRGNNTLGGGNSGDFVYCAFAYMNNVKMDFDVDFALGFNKGNSRVEFFTDAIRYGIQNTAANLGKTNQTGACSNFDLASVFGGTGFLSVAFDSTYPANPQSGVEFKIPYSAFAGADTSQTVRFFVVISAQEGNVSNECIPGDPGAMNLGDGVDFSVIPGQDFFTQPIKISVPKPTTFVLTNEGGLIDDLIRAGNGDKNLYQTLEILKPKSGGVISDEFMAALAKCPVGSDIFTAELTNFAGLNNPVCVNTDGSLGIKPIFGKDYFTSDGYTTIPINQNGYTPELFTYANSAEYYINAGAGIEGGTTTYYKAFAIAWKSSTTFVLTNEGGLIDDLIRAGHGTKNLYQTLEILKPKSGGVISDEYMATLANCPAGSEIFIAALSNYVGFNNPVGINTDGTVTIHAIYGKDYLNKPGYSIFPVNKSGYIPVFVTCADSVNKYIDTGSSIHFPFGYGNYKAFAIAWKASTTFVLTNEGGLIDDLIRAGHGTKNLYQTLEVLKPKSGGVISDEFMATLANCPKGSEIFTAALSNFSVNYPVCINSDGTISIQPIYGKDLFQKEGYTTLPLNQGGYTSAVFTVANSAENYVDAGQTGTYYVNAGQTGTSGETTIYYKAFAIAWKASTTFVLTNEGGLIDDLIRAGHGDKNLYQTLEILKPKSGGVIADEFMATLANCPKGSEIFTTTLSVFGGLNNPICVNTDGTLEIRPIFAKDYLSKEGYTTIPLNQKGYYPQLFTYANSAGKYIDAGEINETGEGNYQAFAIAWKASTTFVLSNEGDGLIDQLIAAGHGDDNLYEVLQFLAADSASGIPADFVTEVGNNTSGSEVFTAALSNFAGLNNPIGINADGTLMITSIYGKDYYGDAGFATNMVYYSGVGLANFTITSDLNYFIDTGMATHNDPNQNYQAIGVAYANNSRSFVLSNESPGYLIDKLIAAGHGDDNLYEVLQFLAADSASGIPADFVAEVGNNTSGSEVFTAALSNFAGLNNPVGINADGTLMITGIYGKDYYGDAGFATNMVYYSGVGLANFTITSDLNYFINTGVDQHDSNQNYQAIGVAYANNSRSFVLSNESPGYLIDKLIAAGHGDDNLYEVLQFLAADSASGIPADFVAEVGNNTSGSEVFTVALSNFAGLNNPVGINADGTMSIQAIFGRDYDGHTGYVTNKVHYTDIAPSNFTMATTPIYYINAGVKSVSPDINYQAIGVAWAGAEEPNSVEARTFIISNEAPGHLIDNLIAAGYRDSSLYAVMQYLQPLSGGAIPQLFMDSLAVCPANSDVFTAKLSNFAGLNNPVGIAEDGTLIIAAIYGRDYSEMEGYTTYNDTLVPVSLKLFTKANEPKYYIDAGSSTYQTPSGPVITFYKAFAIAWSMEPPTTFVLTNEGGLIDDLIRAGNGDKNLYQTLEVLKPKSGGVISDEFMAILANCPAGSEIFTAALSNFAGLNNPVCVNSDGTMSIQAIFVKDYFSKDGYSTIPLNQNGYTPELFTYANSVEKYIDAGSGTTGGTAINYKAFAIAWKASTTFVLTNEGGLIDDLIRAGNGDKNLYQTLEILKPKSGGVISDEFMTTLANCPKEREIFSTQLNNYTGLNNPVCINTDGTCNILGIFGKDYYQKTGYYTWPEQSSSQTELFTVSNDFNSLIEAGFLEPNYYYKAFAIAWSVPDSLAVNNQQLELEAAQGSTASFTISSTASWTIKSSEAWLSVNQVSGSGNATIVVTALANPLVTTRLALVTITTQNGTSVQITVAQKGSATFFTVSPVTLTIGSATQSTASFIVTANVAWAASSNQSWVGIAPVSGDTTKTVVLTVQANPLITSRKAIISITAAGYQTVNVTVTQQAGSPVLQVSPDSVSIAATGTSTQKITVTSNTNWTAGSTETWLSLTPISGKNNGSVTLQAGTNPLASTRMAQIQFTANGTPGSTVAVTQQPGSAFLSVSPDTLTIQAENESTDTIFVSSNAQWLASTDQLWLTIAPSSESGNDTVLVTAQANNYITPRNASVTFSVSGIGNKNVHVKQNGAAPFLFVQNDTLKIAPSGSIGLNIPVQSNINWSIAEDISWLDVSPAESFGNDTILLTVAENLLPEPRSITLYCKGNGFDSVPIYIEQMAADVQLQVSPVQVQIDAAQGSTAILTINSNTAWQVVSNQSWLATNVDSGNGNDTLAVTVTENTTLTERMATLTLTAEGAAPKTVLVTQQSGKATLFVNVNALNIDAGQGSQVSFSITSNTTWIVAPEQNWITANPGSGTGNMMVVLTALVNPMITQRTATVLVSAPGATPVSVTITQAAGNVSLAVSSDTLKIGEQGGSTVSFTVTSNTNWVVTLGQAWLTANPSAGNGNATVILTAQANPSTVMRQSTVTVSAAGTGAKSILVKQPGLNTPLTQELNVTDELTCFPNPFDSQTTIRFRLKESGKIKLSLFDNTGKEVAILLNGFYDSGEFDLNIKVNEYAVPSGFCYCVLKTTDSVLTHKLINVH